MGARPLKRFLRRELDMRLGRELIAGNIADGATVRVGVQDGVLSIDATV